MRLLGIDFGTKYVGLAIADERLNIAFPYKNLEYKKETILNELMEVIKKEKIKKIIVGRPISLSGKLTEQTKITDKFINFLKKNLKIPVEDFDERFSSKIVTSNIQNPKSKIKDNHAAAAAVILQEYLERLKKKVENKKGPA